MAAISLDSPSMDVPATGLGPVVPAEGAPATPSALVFDSPMDFLENFFELAAPVPEDGPAPYTDDVYESFMEWLFQSVRTMLYVQPHYVSAPPRSELTTLPTVQDEAGRLREERRRELLRMEQSVRVSDLLRSRGV